MNTRKLAYASLLLGVALVSQSLRFVVPLPPVIAPFVIGGLVNACLFLAATVAGLRAGFIIAFVTPVAAYFQGQLPLPVFIIPVFAGNALLVSIYWLFERKARIFAVILAALLKTAALYVLFRGLLAFISLPVKVAAALMFVMSWPQFVSGIAGGFITLLIIPRIINKREKNHD